MAEVMKSPCPNSVKVAIGCIIASDVISTVEMLAFLNLSDWGNVIQIIIATLAVCAIVYGIYVRKNWVRWLFVAMIAIWLMSLLAYRSSGHDHFHGVRLLSLALNLIFSAVSVILLFYPESNDWFRKQPAPPAIEPQIKS